jgi:acetyltransferase-like isoleucine patch superfamily enzyme
VSARAPDAGTPPWHHLPANRWNPHAWVVGEPDVGEGCWIGAFTVIDGSGGLTIGPGCDISAGAQIYTHSTVQRAVTGGRAPVERRPTRIGAQCHIGAAAVVLMGVVLGDRCVVGAGAVVREGTVAPDDSVLVGVPARVLPRSSVASEHLGESLPAAAVRGDDHHHEGERHQQPHTE